MPSNPYDWEQDQGFDPEAIEFLEELMGPDHVASVIEDAVYERTLWLESDQESYPIWSTTLWEQDQIWRTKFNLRTAEQRHERLAQEAALYILLNDFHDS